LDEVETIELTVARGKAWESGTLFGLYLASATPESVAAPAPVVDALGQRIQGEWPTKTHSLAEMRQRVTAEYSQALHSPARRGDRSRWGGFREKHFAATGWFRTVRDQGRWWLVDPDGYAFFSHGVCYGTRMGEFGWYTGMKSFYETAPKPDDPVFAGAFIKPAAIAEYVKRNGLDRQSGHWMINPARINMMRIFGSDWWEAWRMITTNRFHEWGLNTTGVGVVNYTDERLEDFLRLSGLPYVLSLKDFPMTRRRIFRDFPDVFADEYLLNSRAYAVSGLAAHAGKPALIGYFLNNEPEWMFQEDCNLAYEMLVCEHPLETRKHWAAWISGRYADIGEFGVCWQLSCDSFDRLLEPLPRSYRPTERAKNDLEAYERILMRRYADIPLQECRRVTGNHLCLGLRYSNYIPRYALYNDLFDVLSFNCYKRDPSEKLRLAASAGKPVIIGEWHVGEPESGLWRSGHICAATSTDRGKAYRHYVETAAAFPCCVGTHYFEYNDQSLLGRFDGEHMAHGLIDCTNRPYPEMARAISACSDALYGVLTGSRPPFAEPVSYRDPAF
ncbi:MAG TPA: beta-galactosidase, partial [Clostridiales bacterium]|nr:beta-galactosidase [Clostridiales bacterium]